MALQLNLPLLHFWDKTTSAFSKIAIMYSHGANCNQVDVVCHAWEEICDTYFPKVAAADNASRWVVDRDAYRGHPPLEPLRVKHDAIVVKLISIISNDSNFSSHITSRNFLWIECRAATEDTPCGWKNALAEAATHLGNASSTRMLYLVIAVGWKCAFFVWDPINSLRRPEIFIRQASNQQQPWIIDQRIKNFFNFSWVDNLSGEFNPTRALELECFWNVIENGIPVLANHRKLAIIEQFLVYIHNSALQGLNPATF